MSLLRLHYYLLLCARSRLHVPGVEHVRQFHYALVLYTRELLEVAFRKGCQRSVKEYARFAC
jgi:hypothetical protein